MSHIENSYEAHKRNFNERTEEVEARLFHIKHQSCLQYQLIKQTLDQLSPFLQTPASWLTVGDYNGLEANYLLNQKQQAVASDISEFFLKEAKIAGLIDQYKTINVEAIDYPADTFDYVFCKEAFHHFPRAFLGLYEMIRCAKKAAILIEPIDVLSKMPTLLFLKNVLDRIDPLLINKIWKNRFSFEIVGNYVFKVSERDIEKIAMGMGLPLIAFKRINLILEPKIPTAALTEPPMNQRHWKRVQRKIKRKNFLSKLHILPYNHLCCVVFKDAPSLTVLQHMKQAGYFILPLPKNPYL